MTTKVSLLVYYIPQLHTHHNQLTATFTTPPRSLTNTCTSISTHSYCSRLISTATTADSYQVHAKYSRLLPMVISSINQSQLPGQLANAIHLIVHSQSPCPLTVIAHWLLLTNISIHHEHLTITTDSNHSQLRLYIPGPLTPSLYSLPLLLMH